MKPLPIVRTPTCATCPHLQSEHRIDLKIWACGHGCGLPGLRCDCTEYTPRTEEARQQPKKTP